MSKILGKYGIIFKDYLREYKKEMYKTLIEKGNLIDYCYEREKELKVLYERIENQLRKQYPKPNTNEFVKAVQYENSIASMVNEIVLDNIRF